MSASAVKGWCPGALRPMLSGDGFVVRVRPFGGRLEAPQISGLAELAERFGNGLIDVTRRANLQIRGVKEESHRPLLDGLARLQLLDPDADMPAVVRSITAGTERSSSASNWTRTDRPAGRTIAVRSTI